MPMFDVEIYRIMIVSRFAMVEIEADTEAEAKAIALKQYAENPYPLELEEILEPGELEAGARMTEEQDDLEPCHP